MTHQREILDDPRYRPVLDYGFIGLRDHMGSDSDIVQAARVSYAAGTKTVNSDRGLIRYLMRHHHTTPFEMCELKFHCRAPILAIRQWFRHRTASINEESARYSEMSDEFYLPEPDFIQPQSADNKQGRDGSLAALDQKGVRWLMDAAYDHSFQTYKILRGDREGSDPDHPGGDVLYDPYSESHPLLTEDFDGVARELARAVMPVGAYSEFYWKLNLHNLFNFCRLRADNHAQKEIRVFADAIIELAKPLFPMAFEAFDDYVRHAVTLSRMEFELVASLLRATSAPQVNAGDLSPAGHCLHLMLTAAGSTKQLAEGLGMSLRELRDFAEKFGLAEALV